MPDFQARRTLVKSPPELWTEVSDPQSLARHLGEFGEIKITRLEAETTVAWEGERASGTVELAPAGWGTAVTLTAEPVAVVEAAEPDPAPEPEPEPIASEPMPARRTWLASLFRRRAAPVEVEAATPIAEPTPEPEPAADPLLDALTSALDSLGTAHHRPFSRG
jgi:hypothetical protein